MRGTLGQKNTLIADFGVGQGSLATVGYKLWNGDGTQFQARTTTGVAETVAATGIYKVELAAAVFSVIFEGYVVWDTGGASPKYVSEEVVIAAAPDNASVSIILGMLGANQGIRNAVYSNDSLLSYDLYLYDTSAHATLNDGTTGVTGHYQIVSTYTAGNLSTTAMTRVL